MTATKFLLEKCDLGEITSEDVIYMEGLQALVEEYAEQQAVEFGKWKDKLRLDEKITLHPPAGSGLPTGPYIMTNEQLYKKWQDDNRTV
ncbi:MAG: hypothetical protein ACREHG_10675 [Candidatus Saccharimonadales bacterium]